MSPGERSAILLKNAANDARDVLRWTIARGGPASPADLKNLAAPGASVAVCLYDASTAAQPLLTGVVAAGGTCGTKPCWKTLGGGSGYLYRNDAGAAAGLTGLRFKVPASGALQLAVTGRGVNLPLPTLPLTLPVTMQVAISDGAGTVCWESRVASAHRNDPATFKASSP
jgi:hypothetical protein